MFLWSIVGYGYSYQAVSVTDLFTQKDRYNIFQNLVPINSSPCCHGHPLSRFLKWMKPLLFSTTNEGILYVSPSSLRQQSRNRISWLILMREEGLLILTDFLTLWCLHNQFKAHFPFSSQGCVGVEEAGIASKAKAAMRSGAWHHQLIAPSSSDRSNDDKTHSKIWFQNVEKLTNCNYG